MSPWSLALLVSPFLALAVVLCVVVVVAVRRARPEDVPIVLYVFVVAFIRLADRLPRRRRRRIDSAGAGVSIQESVMSKDHQQASNVEGLR